MVSLSPANGALHEVWSRFEHVQKKSGALFQGERQRKGGRDGYSIYTVVIVTRSALK